jgi:hypothetical protein
MISVADLSQLDHAENLIVLFMNYYDKTKPKRRLDHAK